MNLWCYYCFRSPGGAVEEMESEEETVPMVTVAGEQVPYDEVTEEMVERLTPAEKEEYIRVGQQIYEDMYSWDTMHRIGKKIRTLGGMEGAPWVLVDAQLWQGDGISSRRVTRGTLKWGRQQGTRVKIETAEHIWWKDRTLSLGMHITCDPLP